MRLLAKTNIDFIKWRWHAIALSVLVIGAGIATIIARGGMPLGVDFTGGTVLVVKFQQPVSEDTVRSSLGAFAEEAVVQRFGPEADATVMVRLPLTEGGEQADALETAAQQVQQALSAANVGSFEIIGRDLVGATIGRDLQRKGIMATLTAIGGILLYIALRFRFAFAVGAVVATFHDLLIVLVFLAWFGYDLSLNIVAAVLTIAGYSVNDTIVIFDRVRENQRLLRREPLEKIVNTAVNQTLSRTVVTAGTTFLAVFSLYLFGGPVLNGFAFAMLIGILAGTYSTVFIASALAILLSRQPPAPANVRTAESRRARA